ncbi:hypothetical protein GCK72_016718 [Caenorhabditis remanei]|uniref:Ground-like domain-containing protein n=1 Tax=Caenorhabditis remanei TaxID=31234 RepID=A0A6A5G644_CAERE|nr:hypothetical protein GCK72_016718 [Caenorhabditis remanei]KAF1750171.1 hypothetical protein GCK72_016718 [Caenorhabditis remanei]
MLFRLVFSSLLLAHTTSAFFFGGGGGGCGCQPAPACAPHPAPAPCSGGSIVQGYVGAPQQGGYAAAPQFPQQGGGYQQGPPPPAPYQPQGGYQAGPAPAQIAPQGGYQAPVQQVPQGGYQAPAQQVNTQGPVESAQVQEVQQAGGNYQDAPAPAQVAPAQQETAAAPAPTDTAAYTGEQEVVASLAREEPNYQNTGTNVVEAAQHASELGNQAAAAAAKNAEVIEDEEEPIKKKDEGKTTMMKTVKTPSASSAMKTASTSTSTEFPVGEEVVPDTNEKEVDISELHLTDDPLCNSDDLRKVVIDNIDDQLNSSKRMIQLAAEAQFGGRFDVICANGDFSYVTNTELYCQETKGDISCYTYRQL